MKKEFTNIEELFKDSFETYKVEPSSGVWKNINMKLKLKQFFSANLKNFNVYYSIAIIGVVSIIGLTFLNSEQQNPPVSSNQIDKTELTIENGNKSHENISKNENNVIQHNRNNKKESIKKQRVIKKESSRISEIIPFTKQQKLKAISQLSVDSANKLKQITVLPPKPLFKLENKEGCAPFEIKLQNYSELAHSYEWSFGDGSKSKEKNPSYTYLYPGVYTIKLKAIGLGGFATSLFDSIIVHEAIDHKISKSFDNELLEGEPFVVSEREDRIAEYEWNFGDGSMSKQNNPNHAYKEEGRYTITLKTWTVNNCYDSVKVADAIVVKSNTNIKFPNAFCPNQNGPSSGSYDKRNIYNDIFHPVVKGEIEKYELKIYSRAGLLVFKTNDVNIGWDGYFQNRLMPEGVYVYIVSGKFEGGRLFQKKGNVTMIYRKSP